MAEERDKLKVENEQRQEEIFQIHKKVTIQETEVEKFKSELKGVKQMVQEKQNNPKITQLTELFKLKDKISFINAPINELKSESFDLE